MTLLPVTRLIIDDDSHDNCSLKSLLYLSKYLLLNYKITFFLIYIQYFMSICFYEEINDIVNITKIYVENLYFCTNQ